MKFQITKENFINGLQQVQHVVNSRTTLPILSNVLLVAEDDGIRLTTTDLDVGVTAFIGADIEKKGSTTLPARRLSTIIRELPAEEIKVEVDDNNVASIKSGTSFFKILGLSGDEFPSLPDFEDAMEFKLKQKDIYEMFKMTSYSISTDETRYVLNGVYCIFEDSKLMVVATDGRRLAMAENEVEFPESQKAKVIIPIKAVNELQRLLQDQEGEVYVQVTENQISLELGNGYLVSKLIDGNYPNYQQVIPGEPNYRITLEREKMLESIKRISLLTSEKSSSVRFRFMKDNLSIEANSPDIGEATEDIPIKYDGEEMSIAFNPEYFMAPLRNLDTDEVYLNLIDEGSPGVIKIPNATFLYVIMPMRVSQ